MPRRYRCIARLLAAVATGIFTLPALAADAATPVVVNLHTRAEILQHDTRKGTRFMLPRLLLFDGRGRLVMATLGDPADVEHRLRRALKEDKPVIAQATLAMALAETEDAEGRPVAVDALPKADAYVADYWADWCAPCHILARDLERILPRWDGVRVVWLKIESDPTKLPRGSK